MQYVCRNGFEHHVVMNASKTADILKEAFEVAIIESHQMRIPKDPLTIIIGDYAAVIGAATAVLCVRLTVPVLTLVAVSASSVFGAWLMGENEGLGFCFLLNTTTDRGGAAYGSR
jgi:hypothetical protein